MSVSVSRQAQGKQGSKLGVPMGAHTPAPWRLLSARRRMLAGLVPYAGEGCCQAGRRAGGQAGTQAGAAGRQIGRQAGRSSAQHCTDTRICSYGSS